MLYTHSLIRLLAAVDAKTGLPKVTANQGQVTSALQVVFGIIGALAVIFVIFGGFSFITAQGDPQAASKARQTIIYAVIGLVIALAAELIVTFVLNKI